MADSDPNILNLNEENGWDIDTNTSHNTIRWNGTVELLVTDSSGWVMNTWLSSYSQNTHLSPKRIRDKKDTTNVMIRKHSFNICFSMYSVIHLNRTMHLYSVISVYVY